MDNAPLLTGTFPGTGLLACVVLPGLLVIGGRVPDPMEDRNCTTRS